MHVHVQVHVHVRVIVCLCVRWPTLSVCASRCVYVSVCAGALMYACAFFGMKKGTVSFLIFFSFSTIISSKQTRFI